MNKPKLPSKMTDFGYKQVPLADKAKKVAEVFHSVAKKYDIMNDLMSLGIHRVWKRLTLDKAQIQRGEKILDLASGTGDLAIGLIPRVGPEGLVVLADINDSMLNEGRDRLIDQGLVSSACFVQADAEKLPFPDDHFDCVTIAFGLRNVSQKDSALRSIHRILKPGGRLLVLEFSKPVHSFIRPFYDMYSFTVLPALGRIISNDADSYRYLAESIRMHPDQETLKQMILQAGFGRCEYHNMSAGIVALHQGFKC